MEAAPAKGVPRINSKRTGLDKDRTAVDKRAITCAEVADKPAGAGALHDNCAIDVIRERRHLAVIDRDELIVDRREGYRTRVDRGNAAPAIKEGAKAGGRRGIGQDKCARRSTARTQVKSET